jgi:hypothetical protein
MVEFLVDGMDVTGMAPIQGILDFPQGQAFVVYVPEAPLAPGSHEAMITVWAPDGTSQSHAWTFEAADVPCAGPPPPAPGAPIGTAPEGQPQSAPPPLPLSGVLHFVANQTTQVPQQQGSQPQSRQIELWFDPGSGNSRLVVKDGSGAQQVANVRSGRTLVQFLPEKRAQTTILLDERLPNPDLEWIERSMGLKAALDRGELQPLGEEAISGRPALRLQPAETADVWLDRDTGLIMREIVRAPGASEEISNRQVTQLELLESSRVPADVFSTTVAADWQHTTSRILTPDDARAFRGFDIYWLGQEYRGLGLANLTRDEGSTPQGSFSGVSVTYAPTQPPSDSQQAPSQILIQQYQPSAQELQARQQAQGSLPPGAERVTVSSGRTGVLMVQQGAPVRLDITVGRTAVVIIAADRSEAMRVGQDLQKLN